MDNTSTVEINGSSYQIGRFTAEAGSWILLQVLPKVTNAFVFAQGAQTADQFSIGLISQIIGQFSSLDEDAFRRIQQHALAVCRRIENGVPMPIFVPPNKWAIKELEYDTLSVMALTAHALVFNLSPFFDANALKGFFPTLSMSDGTPSTSQS
jgi:hypothetical protein